MENLETFISDPQNDQWVNYYRDEVQTYAEEIINTITHALGLILSIPATIILVSLARHHGNRWHVFGCALYGLSLIAMYTCSTMYHWSGVLSMEMREFLRDLDHCAIYFLIAGTYTPLTLINLVHDNLHPTRKSRKRDSGKNGSSGGRNMVFLGVVVLVVVWTICIVGVTSKLIVGAEGVPPLLSYGSYLLMGWLAVVVARPFLMTLPRTGLRLLFAGGIAYTVGVGFLVSDALPFNHPVWHLFVGAGSTCHYLSVIACTIPIDATPWMKMEKRTRSVILDYSTRFVLSNLIG